MTITRLFPSGAWEIVEIIDSQLVKRVYFGWSKREAKAMFKREMRLLQAKTEGR